jgi:hypothetical protein
LPARLWAFLEGHRYDAELADGISPMKSIYHGARADRITTRRACRRVAQALQGAVEAAEQQPPNHLDCKVRVDSSAIRVCRDEVLSLAHTLATVERPPARGVAIVRQLVFDGRSPLFFQSPDRRKGGDRRLASALFAAQRALEVAADFDCVSVFPVHPQERSPEMAVDTHDDPPVVDRGTGERDLMLGMIVGAVMAFGAIALAIIFSLT